MKKNIKLKLYRVSIDKPSSLEMMVFAENKRQICKGKLIKGLSKDTRVKIIRKKIKLGIAASWGKIYKEKSGNSKDAINNPTHDQELQEEHDQEVENT